MGGDLNILLSISPEIEDKTLGLIGNYEYKYLCFVQYN